MLVTGAAGGSAPPWRAWPRTRLRHCLTFRGDAARAEETAAAAPSRRVRGRSRSGPTLADAGARDSRFAALDAEFGGRLDALVNNGRHHRPGRAPRRHFRCGFGVVMLNQTCSASPPARAGGAAHVDAKGGRGGSIVNVSSARPDRRGGVDTLRGQQGRGRHITIGLAREVGGGGHPGERGESGLIDGACTPRPGCRTGWQGRGRRAHRGVGGAAKEVPEAVLSLLSDAARAM